MKSMQKLIIALVWLLFIGGALRNGISAGSAAATLHTKTGEIFPPLNVALVIFCFMFLVGSGVFFTRYKIRYAVIVRIKPVALLIVSAFTWGISGLFTTFMGSRSWTAYVNSGAVIALGSGLTVAYLLSRKFPPELQ